MVKLVHWDSVDHRDLVMVVFEDKDHVEVLEVKLDTLKVNEFHFIQRYHQRRLHAHMHTLMQPITRLYETSVATSGIARLWGALVQRGPSLSLPSISPSIPFPSPFPPLLQPSPSPCRRAAPANPARGSGRAPAEVEFGAFYALCSLLLVFSK